MYSTNIYLIDIKHSAFGYARQMNSTDFVGVYVFSIDSGDIPQTKTNQSKFIYYFIPHQQNQASFYNIFFHRFLLHILYTK